MKIYLVGGAVRDEILGKPANDRDWVVFGADEKEFLSRYPGAKKVGTRKPVYIYHGEEYILSEAKDIHEDLMGRDLTINAFARDESGQLFSHPLALMDLENKLLRQVADKNFYDDPLRVFRVARFCAQLPEFNMVPSLPGLISSVEEKRLLDTIPAERIGKEVSRAFAAPSPGRFISVIHETRITDPWLGEISNAHLIPAGPAPFHNESLLEHITMVMDALRGESLRVWMGFCHDLGKTATDPEDWPKHHLHTGNGEKIARRLGTRLRLSTRFVDAGAYAAGLHMTAGRYDKLRSGTKVGLLMELKHHDLLKPMFELVFADKGLELLNKTEKDLEKIENIRLPKKYHGLGKKSGEILHQLRARALA